jgi:hypothetical protein
MNIRRSIIAVSISCMAIVPLEMSSTSASAGNASAEKPPSMTYIHTADLCYWIPPVPNFQGGWTPGHWACMGDFNP